MATTMWVWTRVGVLLAALLVVLTLMSFLGVGTPGSSVAWAYSHCPNRPDISWSGTCPAPPPGNEAPPGGGAGSGDFITVDALGNTVDVSATGITVDAEVLDAAGL